MLIYQEMKTFINDKKNFFDKYNNVKNGNILLNQLSDEELIKVLLMSKEELDLKIQKLQVLDEKLEKIY